MTETLRLRCLRCGDWHTREVGDWYLTELCVRCVDRGHCLLFSHGYPAYKRHVERWDKAPANHPTRLAVHEAAKRWMDPNDFAASAAMEDP